MNKRDFKYYLTAILFEIIALFFALVVFILLFNAEVTRALITNYTFFRPSSILAITVIFTVLTVIWTLMLLMQIRKKKLGSTKKLSMFAKTVERSHKVRAISITQVMYASEYDISASINVMPSDIDSSIVELYFQYEKNLNI